MTRDAGSVWWAELFLGLVSFTIAAVFVLLHTALGPFSKLTVSYGALPSGLYLTVVFVLGLLFLRSGLRRAPRRFPAETTDDGAAGDAGTIPGRESEA